MLIGVEAADERVRFQKVQLRRSPSRFEQRAQVVQVPRAVVQRFLGRAFQCLGGMLLRQRQQAVQDPDANGSRRSETDAGACADR